MRLSALVGLLTLSNAHTVANTFHLKNCEVAIGDQIKLDWLFTVMWPWFLFVVLHVCSIISSTTKNVFSDAVLKSRMPSSSSREPDLNTCSLLFNYNFIFLMISLYEVRYVQIKAIITMLLLLTSTGFIIKLFIFPPWVACQKI